jgi:hypothetical protein
MSDYTCRAVPCLHRLETLLQDPHDDVIVKLLKGEADASGRGVILLTRRPWRFARWRRNLPRCWLEEAGNLLDSYRGAIMQLMVQKARHLTSSVMVVSM